MIIIEHSLILKELIESIVNILINEITWFVRNGIVTGHKFGQKILSQQNVFNTIPRSTNLITDTNQTNLNQTNRDLTISKMMKGKMFILVLQTARIA